MAATHTFGPRRPSSCMSLGFNPNRPIRTTNLPGAVGNSVVSMASQRRRVSPGAARRAAPAAPNVRVVVPTPEPQKLAPVPQKPAPVEEDGLRSVFEEAQWVYADAREPLVAEGDGEEVAPAGGRVMLVYPMKTDEVTGRVTMRLKRVHALTGQLSYCWVVVYDPEREGRPVTNFSLLP